MNNKGCYNGEQLNAIVHRINSTKAYSNTFCLQETTTHAYTISNMKHDTRFPLLSIVFDSIYVCGQPLTRLTRQTSFERDSHNTVSTSVQHSTQERRPSRLAKGETMAETEQMYSRCITGPACYSMHAIPCHVLLLQYYSELTQHTSI